MEQCQSSKVNACVFESRSSGKSCDIFFRAEIAGTRCRQQTLCAHLFPMGRREESSESYSVPDPVLEVPVLFPSLRSIVASSRSPRVSLLLVSFSIFFSKFGTGGRQALPRADRLKKIESTIFERYFAFSSQPNLSINPMKTNPATRHVHKSAKEEGAFFLVFVFVLLHFCFAPL